MCTPKRWRIGQVADTPKRDRQRHEVREREASPTHAQSLTPADEDTSRSPAGHSRVSDLLGVSRWTIDRMADADLSPALRDRQLLEGARTCLAETAGRGSTVEEREAAVVWLREATRDERQQVAAARRKIAAMTR